MWKSPILASSAAMQKSQEIINSKPPATAYPSTTAIVGFERLNARSNVRADTCAIFTELFVVPRNSLSSMLRSAPAQNVYPRPRMRTTRAASSSSARSSAAPSWVRRPQLTQFLTSGRFSQIVATPSSTSYCTNCSVAGLPLTRTSALMSLSISESSKLNSNHIVTMAAGARADPALEHDGWQAVATMPYLNSLHVYRRGHQPAAGARRLRERVAPSRRPADPHRH